MGEVVGWGSRMSGRRLRNYPDQFDDLGMRLRDARNTQCLSSIAARSGGCLNRGPRIPWVVRLGRAGTLPCPLCLLFALSAHLVGLSAEIAGNRVESPIFVGLSAVAGGFAVESRAPDADPVSARRPRIGKSLEFRRFSDDAGWWAPVRCRCGWGCRGTQHENRGESRCIPRICGIQARNRPWWR